MAEQRYVTFTDRASGIRFVFRTEPGHPDILHIFARHLASPPEAIAAFFDGESTWNEDRRRFETFSDSHGLYWFWLEPDRAVMVISCFKLEASR